MGFIDSFVPLRLDQVRQFDSSDRQGVTFGGSKTQKFDRADECKSNESFTATAINVVANTRRSVNSGIAPQRNLTLICRL